MRHLFEFIAAAAAMGLYTESVVAAFLVLVGGLLLILCGMWVITRLAMLVGIAALMAMFGQPQLAEQLDRVLAVAIVGGVILMGIFLAQHVRFVW